MKGENRLRKIFGIGPGAAVISILFFVIAAWADSIFKLPISVDHAGPIKTVGILLVILGLGLHCWSFSSLRSWWSNDKLCTRGPFRLFRHPMYAAWITFICPGLALYFNSWFYGFWVVLLHLMWHQFVRKEESLMADTFGDTYNDYARRTGRFFPKMLNRMGDKRD